MPAPPAASELPDPPATRLWLRIAGAEEAALAAAAGIDGVETPPDTAPAVRAAFAGPLRLRLDAPPEADLDAEEVSLPADMLAAPAGGGGHAPLPLAQLPLAQLPLARLLLARVPLADATPERVAALAGRAAGVTIEVAAGERLFAAAGIAELDGCARACRVAGLSFGLSGNLEPPDVARLLLLAPDHLGFHRAARLGHEADGPLDPAALAVLRGLVPRRPAPPPAGGTLDRLFVRDLVLPLSIGAYRAEREARQRVRFTVEAEVVRSTADPRDMRDVVSYDIIIETIRMLAARPHVAFVETLAEDIAATLLGQPRLVAVAVQVEKLDVVDGSVGIRIERRRPS